MEEYMMQKSILSIVCCAVLLVQSLNAQSSIEDELKSSSTGSVSSRFRVGYSIGVGYQGRLSGDGDTKIQGLLLESGVYALFNPVRNFFDIEIGISGKYNTGMSSSSSDSGEVSYYSGLKQVTLYGGTVFRFGEEGKALSVGISKALYIDEVQSDELKAQGYEKHDLENGIGAYLEYQTDEIGGNIFFIRAELEKIDIVSQMQTSNDIVGTILCGMKY